MVEADAEAWLQDEGTTEDKELGDACAAMASAARTFVEARTLLNQVKDARGYFPVVGLGAWQPEMAMATPQKTSKGKGRRLKARRGREAQSLAPRLEKESLGLASRGEEVVLTRRTGLQPSVESACCVDILVTRHTNVRTVARMGKRT